MNRFIKLQVSNLESILFSRSLISASLIIKKSNLLSYREGNRLLLRDPPRLESIWIWEGERLHENARRSSGARRVVFDGKKAADRCGTVERKHSLLEWKFFSVRESTLHSGERTVRLIGGSSTGLNRRIILVGEEWPTRFRKFSLGVHLFVPRI